MNGLIRFGRHRMLPYCSGLGQSKVDLQKALIFFQLRYSIFKMLTVFLFFCHICRKCTKYETCTKLHRFHNRPHCEKTCLQCFRQSEFQTSLLSYRDYLDILLVTSIDMILSKKGITKALISLSVCAGWSIRAGWSAPLLFPNQ